MMRLPRQVPKGDVAVSLRILLNLRRLLRSLRPLAMTYGEDEIAEEIQSPNVEWLASQ